MPHEVHEVWAHNLDRQSMHGRRQFACITLPGLTSAMELLFSLRALAYTAAMHCCRIANPMRMPILRKPSMYTFHYSPHQSSLFRRAKIVLMLSCTSLSQAWTRQQYLIDFSSQSVQVVQASMAFALWHASKLVLIQRTKAKRV